MHTQFTDVSRPDLTCLISFFSSLSQPTLHLCDDHKLAFTPPLCLHFKPKQEKPKVPGGNASLAVEIIKKPERLQLILGRTGPVSRERSLTRTQIRRFHLQKSNVPFVE